MNRKTEKREHHSRFVFWMICIMHDNPLLPIFRNPYRLLETAGLKPGQKVLEVGCGPGFFTIPAARMVGDEGIIYAVDVHPLAIKRVQKKIKREKIKNVTPILGNAADTGLPDRSIDLAFLFGLGYIAGGLENLVSEMRRILKPEGLLSFEKTRGPEKELIDEVERGGFIYSGRQRRIFLFAKSKSSEGP
jgi:ubiquinone/menaquinone biosynthesis C-methylase UbiE